MKIKLTEPLNDISMEINMNIPQMNILKFLSQKGYEIKAFQYSLSAEKTFLTDEIEDKICTFTATKENEEPSESNLYLKVFEKEIKALLNAI